MSYNPLCDLLIMGALLTMLGLFIKLTSYDKRGATPESEIAVLKHQHKRRIWMMANVGLPMGNLMETSDGGWTEGKWRVVERVTNGVNGYEICWSDDGEAVTDHVYEKADAHVMAASKELYDALHRLVIHIESSGVANSSDIEVSLDALAKARGES